MQEATARVQPMAVGRMKSGTAHQTMEDRAQMEIQTSDVPSTLLAMVSYGTTRGTTQEELMVGTQEDGSGSIILVTGSQALVLTLIVPGRDSQLNSTLNVAISRSAQAVKGVIIHSEIRRLT
jgi:hypothetical protein